MFLDRLRVRQKIRLPIWLLACFTFVVAFYGVAKLQAMIEFGHVEQAKAQVESAIAIAQNNYDLFKNGSITEEEAQTRARDAIRAMVFNGSDRVFAFDSKGVRIVSNEFYPEGSSAWRSPQTKSMIKNALNGGGITFFDGERTVNGIATGPHPIAAWSAHFEPFDWIVATAVYLDDVTNAINKSLIELSVFLGLSGLLVFVIANAISNDLTRPLMSLTGNMKKLAKSETNVQISGLGRKDEIGEMAAAMETFLAHEVQRQLLQKQLTNLAYTDSLTGLANRSLFHETLGEIIDVSKQTGQSCALMVLDLDRFKSVNDTMGHLAGDSVLKEFSKNLQGQIREGDVVGRLSGDEFFIIVPVIESEAAITEFAETIMACTAQPMMIDGQEVRIETSIGIAFGPRDSAVETKLYQCADMALYEAKIGGGARALCYSPEMGRKAAELYELEAAMVEGLSKGQFNAYYQAKIDLTTGKTTGAEALCRWECQEKGVIPPSKFIPVAEKSSIINEIGATMLWQSCEMAIQCNRISDTPFAIAVNVSVKQLQHGRFLEELDRCLTQTGCDPAWIELEMTESLLVHDDEHILTVLNAIAQLGVAITIDDFGTGYSSMSYLTRFPIKCLKIDRSFVMEMDTDKDKQVLVKAIQAMAEGLGLKTVAEGVETQAVAEMLKALNCDVGQGYLWNRPSKAPALISRLEQENL